ncbi:MAG: hypothetical protein KAU27_14885 [Desulfuromonadales bacterium]|nr:hypothetical protein [Desulfuromonadales bacterium]
MKTVRILLSMVVGSASVVYATTATPSEGAGFLTYCFVGFFAMIIVFQLMPAMVLFAGMIKGLFSRPEKTSVK